MDLHLENCYLYLYTNSCEICINLHQLLSFLPPLPKCAYCTLFDVSFVICTYLRQSCRPSCKASVRFAPLCFLHGTASEEEKIGREQHFTFYNTNITM